MKSYAINKGIGRTVEFRGLKSQFLFIFAGGLLAVLILVMILYMAGVHAWLCLTTGAGCGSVLIWQTFALNKKYGEYGLMKRGARKKYPRYIICRKSLRRYLQFTAKQSKP